MRPSWIARALAASALLFFLLYSPEAEPRFTVCGFLWLTGRPCPLCGMTRALCALAKGQWQAALGFHCLSPVAMAAILTVLARGNIVIGRAWQACGAAFGIAGAARILGISAQIW
jgi:hypothetical protein